MSVLMRRSPLRWSVAVSCARVGGLTIRNLVRPLPLQSTDLLRRPHALRFGLRAFGAEARARADGADARASTNQSTSNDDDRDAEAKRAEESASKDAAGESESTAKETQSEPVLSTEEKLEMELAELQEKVRTKKHELLLSLADFENNKKKFTKERESRRRNATLNFSQKIVEVYDEVDGFRKTEGEVLGMSEACKAFYDGVLMSTEFFRSAMERSGVQQIKPTVGEPFSPGREESVGLVQTNDLEVNSVAEVQRFGWQLQAGSGAGPTVIQKAKVLVAHPVQTLSA